MRLRYAFDFVFFLDTDEYIILGEQRSPAA